MPSGYTRQAAANISAGLVISAADHNAEYNQIQSAFDGTTGHDHSGGSGLGPKVSLASAVTGTLPTGNGGTGATSFSAGSVLFSDGSVVSQDNSKLFWDNTNDRLGVGLAAPANKVHIHSATFSGLTITNAFTGASATDGLLVQIDSSKAAYVWNYENATLAFATNNTQRMLINSGGNVSIGNTNNTYKLDVTGDANISGAYKIAGVNLAASNLSNGVTGSGAVMLAASPTSTGTLNAGAIITSGNLNVGVAAAIGTTLNVAGAAAFASTLSAAATTVTTLHATGNATFDGSLTLGSALGIASGGTGAGTATGAFANLIFGSTVGLGNGGTGAGTQAAAFANIAVAASSIISPNGYIKFANGLILQWGQVGFVAATSTAVVFPLAFPTIPFGVFLTGIYDDCIISVGATTTGFTAGHSVARTCTDYWFALGV